MKRSLIINKMCGKCHNWYCGICNINQEYTDALDVCNKKDEFISFKRGEMNE